MFLITIPCIRSMKSMQTGTGTCRTDPYLFYTAQVYLIKSNDLFSPFNLHRLSVVIFKLLQLLINNAFSQSTSILWIENLSRNLKNRKAFVLNNFFAAQNCPLNTTAWYYSLNTGFTI